MARNASLNAKVGLGVKFKFTVPDFAMPYLELMDNQSIGQAIREALRSAGRPAAVMLKQLLKADLINSEQSTGATERAVTVKYGRSKSNPNRFYCIVGISTNHFELHSSTIPEGQVTRLKRGRKQRGMGLFARQFRLQRKGVVKSKQVFSRYRDSKRLAKTGGKAFKRYPRKYFHLIDKGFRHKFTGNRVAGYEFIQKLKNAIGGSLQKAFNERLKNLIIPTIQKEIARRWKNVLK